MKFGLSFLPDGNDLNLTASEYYTTALQLAQMADEAGMSTIKMTEHYLHPYGGFCPDPITFLAAVAARTKHIRLMTGCILPVFEHPVKIAAKTAMLDAISHGRLDVGFARAYLPHEFTAFDIPMDGSRERYEKTIEAVIQLWSQTHTTISNEFFNLDDVTSYPRPVQQPHPPVWGAAVMSRQSFSWLAEKGFNLLITPPLDGLSHLYDKIKVYLETFCAAHPTRTPEITLSMPLLIADTEAEATRLSDLYLSHYINVWADATESWSRCSSRDYPGYGALAKVLRANTPDKMRDYMQVMVGTPDRVIEKINQISNAFTLDQIIWQIDFGAQPGYISRRTLELFIQHVLPAISSTHEDVAYAA